MLAFRIWHTLRKMLLVKMEDRRYLFSKERGNFHIQMPFMPILRDMALVDIPIGTITSVFLARTIPIPTRTDGNTDC